MRLTGRADLHMHTTVSDGTATVEQMLDHIVQRGDLDVIAITDHDRLAASLWAYSHRELYPFEIIPGVEVTSSDAHILGLWVTEPIRKEHVHRSDHCRDPCPGRHRHYGSPDGANHQPPDDPALPKAA